MSKDPYLQPAFSYGNRAKRLLWNLTYSVFFRLSPRPGHAWRAFLLRCFGAKLGRDCHIYPHARIWAPWNLICEDVVAVADDAIIYNPQPLHLGSHCTLSQEAYLCGATHAYEEPGFRLISFPMSIGRYAWICARANVSPGVSVGEGAVLALGAVAVRDLAPWTVYGGVPAHPIKVRRRSDTTMTDALRKREQVA